MRIIWDITGFFKYLIKSRRLLYHLALRDYKIRYARNYFGLMWAILEPLAMLLIMLIVFTYLRKHASGEYPFTVFLLSGLIGFEFFNKGLSQASMSIRSYSFIIKLVHIRPSLIPVVSILSTFWTHLIVLAIALVIIVAKGVSISLYWFQLIYFMIATCILLTGLSWLSSAIIVFVNDVQYMVGILMRTLFFLTPIFWDLSMFPEKYHKIFKLNPMYHIVEGYRMCLLYHKPFWSDSFAMISFWCTSLLFLIVGSFVFKKLSHNFDDVTH